jgi:hypothetical protein
VVPHDAVLVAYTHANVKHTVCAYQQIAIFNNQAPGVYHHAAMHHYASAHHGHVHCVCMRTDSPFTDAEYEKLLTTAMVLAALSAAGSLTVVASYALFPKLRTFSFHQVLSESPAARTCMCKPAQLIHVCTHHTFKMYTTQANCVGDSSSFALRSGATYCGRERRCAVPTGTHARPVAVSQRRRLALRCTRATPSAAAPAVLALADLCSNTAYFLGDPETRNAQCLAQATLMTLGQFSTVLATSAIAATLWSIAVREQAPERGRERRALVLCHAWVWGPSLVFALLPLVVGAATGEHICEPPPPPPRVCDRHVLLAP